MKKYCFISFKAFNGKGEVGVGGLVVVCSCCFERIVEELLDYYNKRASFGNMAEKVVITSLTVLDKHTAAQLSENFTNALTIDDGDKEEPVYIERWIARNKDGTLCLYISEEPPTKQKAVWDAEYFDDFVELDGSLFPEVKWSDAEPTKVKIVIEK